MSCPTVRIPHLPGGFNDVISAWDQDEKPCGWFIDVYDGQPEVSLICGGCGLHCGHLINHTIEADGRVHASILCSRKKDGKEQCGWHVYGILDDWNRPKKIPKAPAAELPDC